MVAIAKNVTIRRVPTASSGSIRYVGGGRTTAGREFFTAIVSFSPESVSTMTDDDKADAEARAELDRIALSNDELIAFAARMVPRNEWLDRDETKPF